MELLGDRLRALPEDLREALLVAAVSSEATPELLAATVGRDGRPPGRRSTRG